MGTLSVTSIFAAMIAQYVDSQCSNGYKSQLSFQKLRSNLLSLRQFEQCYTLARWIRNLFKDIIERQGRPPTAQSPDKISETVPGYPKNMRNSDLSYNTSLLEASPPSDELASNQALALDGYSANPSNLWNFMMPDNPSPSRSDDFPATVSLGTQGQQFHPGLWLSGYERL
jgi:hypothetical protein